MDFRMISCMGSMTDTTCTSKAARKVSVLAEF